MARRKAQKLVTRESLAEMLRNDDVEFVNRVIGRALVRLFQRQTDNEQAMNDTNVCNSEGFSGADAKSGSITAKYFLKHKTLLDWQREKWLKPAKNGFPKLCKYAKQLNDCAVRMEAARARRAK